MNAAHRGEGIPMRRHVTEDAHGSTRERPGPCFRWGPGRSLLAMTSNQTDRTPRLPWFPFYADDFFHDELVEELSDNEALAYLRLLNRQWKRGSVPDDPEAVALIGKTSVESAEKLLRTFFRADSETGIAANNRMLEVMEEQNNQAAARSEKARRAAQARWDRMREQCSSMPEQCASMLSDAKERKGKEKREEKKNPPPPPRGEKVWIPILEKLGRDSSRMREACTLWMRQRRGGSWKAPHWEKNLKRPDLASEDAWVAAVEYSCVENTYMKLVAAPGPAGNGRPPREKYVDRLIRERKGRLDAAFEPRAVDAVPVTEHQRRLS